MFGIFVVFTKIYLYDSISRYDKEDKNVKQNEVSAKTGAGYWPVSYTHLDVYKRQGYDRQGKSIFLET